MSKKFPSHPKHPERICWGCDKFCAVSDMACSNERSPHPVELFGEDWQSWGDEPVDIPTTPREAVLSGVKAAA